MNTHLYLLLFSLSLFSSSSISPSLAQAAVHCNPKDYRALLKIKKSLNNPSHLSSWIPNTDCCNWQHVDCQYPQTNRISKLAIFSGEISGQISPSISDLTHLETLILQNITNLTGSIPPSMANLHHLEMLWISHTSLSGPIPNFLNQLPDLYYLDLSFNQFSGSIPPNLSDLKNLESLHLEGNKLTGSIPESFGRFNMGSIPNLYLFQNQISGPIPKSLGDVDFEVLDLSRNRIVGDGSMLFNPDHKKMRSIDLSWNQLEFDFTKVKSFPKSLNGLDISHNKIYGRLPEGINGISELLFLNVSYNRLCGKIPSGGKLQDFEKSSFIHNKCLCGPPLLPCKKF
ncbi:Leucine-rich repeat-containing N-terminal [Macleaya cordata]|uniref:Leucine-rich repeat-containing N-terminal n=1 Tax=Macleaya cordata TaxID=56857 RepID=A0A200QW24_MACCD|nr:Leucine-rich repeat-containing N-terminal [Macleaya cordata]